jgi:hypothetical protein
MTSADRDKARQRQRPALHEGTSHGPAHGPAQRTDRPVMVPTLAEAQARYPRRVIMVLRCRTCSRGHSEGPCQASPEAGTCYCQQCHTRTIMAQAREALESNDIARIRQALAGTYALQFQTITARQRMRQP